MTPSPLSLALTDPDVASRRLLQINLQQSCWRNLALPSETGRLAGLTGEIAPRLVSSKPCRIREGKPCYLRSFLAVCSESPLPTIDPGWRWIGNTAPQTIGKSFSIPWHNSRWRLGAASRRDGGETAGKCGILFLFPKPSSEGSIAKLARVHKHPFAVAEDQSVPASFDSVSPHVPVFPRICPVGRLPLAVKRLSPLEPSDSRIRIVHLQKHPSLGMETSRCLALLTSTVLPLPALNAPSRAQTGAGLIQGPPR